MTGRLLSGGSAGLPGCGFVLGLLGARAGRRVCYKDKGGKAGSTAEVASRSSTHPAARPNAPAPSLPPHPLNAHKTHNTPSTGHRFLERHTASRTHTRTHAPASSLCAVGCCHPSGTCTFCPGLHGYVRHLNSSSSSASCGVHAGGLGDVNSMDQRSCASWQCSWTSGTCIADPALRCL